MCPSCLESDRRLILPEAHVCVRCSPVPRPPDAPLFVPTAAVAAWIEALASGPEAQLSDAQCELCLMHYLGWVPDALILTAHAAEALFEQAVRALPEPPPEPTGTHYGTVGVRAQQASVQCVHCETLGIGEYGERWLVKFVTPCGCELTWFASSDKWLPDAGTTHDVKFTVTKHDLYKGRRVTIIQRAAKL